MQRTRNTGRLRLLVWVLLLAHEAPARLAPVDPETALQAAALAREGAPGIVRAGKGIAEVPKQAAGCFRLPLGLMQMLLSPFPEVDFMDGLKNTGKGLVAPFKLCIAVLEMPGEIVGGIGDATGVLD